MTSSRPEAAFHTLTKRATAVKETRTKRIQSTGTKMAVLNKADAEQEHALGPLHEAALGREAERLRLGPLVGDQRGHRQDGHGQKREVAIASVQQIPGAADHEDGVRDAVGDRVEERAPDRRGARGLGHGAIEQVVHARDDEQ